jgi:hypothetical protein
MQEVSHVFAQLLLIIAVFRQTRAELIQRIPSSAPGRPAIMLRVSFSISASLAALNHASACCCSSAV